MPHGPGAKATGTFLSMTVSLLHGPLMHPELVARRFPSVRSDLCALINCCLNCVFCRSFRVSAARSASSTGARQARVARTAKFFLRDLSTVPQAGSSGLQASDTPIAMFAGAPTYVLEPGPPN